MKEDKVLYDSFNARYLSQGEVAARFVVNDHFVKLIQNNHSLLMGPRGCGKTTLLKMLSIKAIQEYDSLNGSDYMLKIPFRSIYIATDIQWKKQLEILSQKLDDVGLVDNISKCTMLITVLEAVCRTFAEIIQVELNERFVSNVEVELSKSLIDLWHLKKPIVPTLKSIEIYLLSLMSDLNAQVNKVMLLGGEVSLDDLFHYEYFDLVKLGCATFDSIVGLQKKKWALCFDELEIAPTWLQESLISYLRSSNQDYIFKLTTAPIVSIYKKVDDGQSISTPTEGNDYNVIRIWTSDQKELKEWRTFCDKMVSKRLDQISINYKIDPTRIFGSSYLEYSIKEAFPGVKLEYDRDDYQVNTPTWFAMKELASRDKTFEIFLKRKNIDPTNPVPTSLSQVDEVFRKIKQIVIFRLHLKRDADKLRSRKVVPLYYGLPMVYELCDGNPRVLIGLIDEFLSLSIKDNGIPRELSINEQSRLLTKISERYLLILSSHPESTIQLNEANYNIVDLIEKIANYFFNRTIVEGFRMDQYGSFVVDGELPHKLIPLIEFGLYHGAFVYLDNVKAIDNTGIMNKRLRLTYCLYPHFKLIPRVNKDVALSEILKNKLGSQKSLFDSL